MPNRVLPATAVLPIEGEILHDIVVDLVQRDLLLRRTLDCHGDERDIGEGRALMHFHDPLSIADHAGKQRQRHGAGVVDCVQQWLACLKRALQSR